MPGDIAQASDPHARLTAARSALDAQLERLEANAEGVAPEGLLALLDASHAAIALGARLDAGAERLARDVYTFAQASSARLAASAMKAGGSAHLRIGTRYLAVPLTGPVPGADIHAWTRSWYAALVCRDPELIHILAAVPEGALYASGEKSPAGPGSGRDFFWRAAMLALDRDPLVSIEHLEEAKHYASSEGGDAPGTESPLRLFAALEALAEGDTATFPDALQRALPTPHQIVEELREPPRWSELGCMALARLAATRGLPLWRSPQVPARLLAAQTWATLIGPSTERTTVPFTSYTPDTANEHLSLCPYCLMPQSPSDVVCSACEQALSTEARPQATRLAYLVKPRTPCKHCARLILHATPRCAHCKTWQHRRSE